MVNAFSRYALAALLAAAVSGCADETANASDPQTTPIASSGGPGCVSRMSGSIMGRDVDQVGCIENVSQPDAEFRSGCEEIAAAAEEMAEESLAEMQIEVGSSSTEYSSAGCPANPQARCDAVSVSNGEANFHYHSGYSDEELADWQSGCELRGGNWRD